jgi:pimeloyl-ACP methyl ester carboxylesterase
VVLRPHRVQAAVRPLRAPPRRDGARPARLRQERQAGRRLHDPRLRRRSRKSLPGGGDREAGGRRPQPRRRGLDDNPDAVRLRAIKPDLHVGITVGAGHFHPLEVPEQVNGMIERFLDVAF